MKRSSFNTLGYLLSSFFFMFIAVTSFTITKEKAERAFPIRKIFTPTDSSWSLEGGTLLKKSVSYHVTHLDSVVLFEHHFTLSNLVFGDTIRTDTLFSLSRIDTSRSDTMITTTDPLVVAIQVLPYGDNIISLEREFAEWFISDYREYFKSPVKFHEFSRRFSDDTVVKNARLMGCNLLVTVILDRPNDLYHDVRMAFAPIELCSTPSPNSRFIARSMTTTRNQEKFYRDAIGWFFWRFNGTKF